MIELRNPVNLTGRHVGREPGVRLPADWKPYTYRGADQPDRCGTEPGYQLHIQAGETACADCQQAHHRHCEAGARKKRRQRARAKEMKK